MAGNHNSGRRKGSGQKLTQELASEIRKLYWDKVAHMGELAKQFGVSRQTVFSVVHGATWVRDCNDFHATDQAFDS